MPTPPESDGTSGSLLNIARWHYEAKQPNLAQELWSDEHGTSLGVQCPLGNKAPAI